MQKYLIANWKMSVDSNKIDEFYRNIKKVKYPAGVFYGIAMPFVYVTKYASAFKKSGFCIGAQNVAFAESGAYTGEISAKMLKDVNAELCIVGHSERRGMFFEDNTVINKKLQRLLANGIIPVLCVGETLEEYQAKATNRVLGRQLRECLKGIDDISKIIVAYEPVWAIGTGKSASASDIHSSVQFIKQTIRKMYNATECIVPVLYGGSVKSSNANEIFKIKGVDGALVGGASLDCIEFCEIAKNF